MRNWAFLGILSALACGTLFFRMPIILPESTVTETLDAMPAITTAAHIEREIDAIIERMLSIGLRRCCADFQSAAHDFMQRRRMFQKHGRFAYLSDPYLQTLAIAGEEHLCKASSRRELRDLFSLREELLAHDSAGLSLHDSLDGLATSV